MKLQIIPFSDVAADVAKTKANNSDSSNPSSRNQRFCSSLHKIEEITPLIPNTPFFKHSNPPWRPYLYMQWLPLISQSQKMSEHHEFQIPAFLLEDIMRCHSSWVSSGHISRALLDDTVETWESTPSGRALKHVFDGKKQWFFRLDNMSPKDSPINGKKPAKSLQDIVVKLASSMRAYGSLHREKQEAEEQGKEMVIKGVLNLWNDSMDATREFRIFVPPPAVSLGREAVSAEDLRIVAIAQYRWPMPFEPPERLTAEKVAEVVYEGAQRVLQDIIEHAWRCLDKDILDLLLKYGLSFDVIIQQDIDVQLIELNPFGALSGCGACLFNWIVDARVLYGLEDEVPFLITQ